MYLYRYKLHVVLGKKKKKAATEYIIHMCTEFTGDASVNRYI